MSRYEREYRRTGTGRGYDGNMHGRGGGGGFRQGAQGGYQGERGRGGSAFRGGTGYGGDFRAFGRGPHPGREPGWGMEPGSELTGGYSDYSPRGRFGGYYGAWDTRPLGSRADIERDARQRGGRR